MSFTIKLDPRSITEVAKAIDAKVEGIDLACQAGLYQLATKIVEESEALVPVDEGTLRRSRVVDESRVGDYQITIGYGNDAARYALVQHERLDFWHPPKPPGKSKVGGRQGSGPGVDPSTGRGPKYLERPFKKYTKNIERTMLAFIRKNVK